MNEECLKYVRKWQSKRGFTAFESPSNFNYYDKGSRNKDGWVIQYKHNYKDKPSYIIRLFMSENKKVIEYKFSKLTISKIMFIHQIISKRIMRDE